MSVSRQHLRLRRRGDHVEIEDLDSRLGTFVNATRIRRRLLDLGDVVRIGNSPPYRFDGQRLVPEWGRTGVAVTFEHLGVQGDHGQWLLAGVSLQIEPGEFVGVLGPSGAGKSLCLEALGTLRPPHVGRILFDGDRDLVEHVDDFRGQLGQVPQQDLVFPWLTAWENIELAARIRLPGRGDAERQQRSQQALGHVELLDHRDKPASKLSGGQQKRLSVAIELLREPRLLLLDEPTSGLDPGLQGRVMDLLRRLSRQGMTVVCSTHTLDTVNFFDSLVVVGRRHGVGTLAYAGPPTELLDTFGVKHAADLYEKLQDLGAATTAEPGSPATGVPTRESEHSGTRSRTAGRAAKPGIPAAPALSGDHLLLQAAAVCRRSWWGLLRDPMTVVMTGLQPLVLAFLVVLSQHDRGGAVQVHFFLVVSALWMGMTLTVREIVRERPLYQRDRLAGLHPDAYLVGRTATALIPLAVQVLVLFGVALLLVLALFEDGAHHTPREDLLEASWLRGVAVLFLTGVGGMLIGLIISVLARTERAAVAMLPIAILPQFLLSRVAANHAADAWDEPGPFSPLLELGSYWQEGEASVGGLLLMAGSLPLVTRPATGCLNMTDAVSTRLLAGEWVYLLILLTLHAGAVYVLFRIYEGRIEAR